MQIRDVADGVHVDKDDLNVGGDNCGILLWNAGEEIDRTSVRSLLTTVDVVGETASPDNMEFGDAVKIP